MKKIITLVCLFAASYQPLFAEASNLSGTVTIGYDSRYVLYGYRLSRHLYRTDVYVSKSLDEKTPLWGGAWYGYLTDGTYHEVDLYGGVDYMLTGSIAAGLAYSLFNYIEVPYEADDAENEFAAHVSYYGEALSLSTRAQYDTGGKGTLIRTIAGWHQPVNESFALKATAEAGYAVEYYIDGHLWNHAQFRLDAPWQVRDAMTLTPFVLRSIALAAIDDFEEDDTIYGLSASWMF